MSCPRLDSHDHNCHIANHAAGANVGEKEEQGGGNQCPKSSMTIGGEDEVPCLWLEQFPEERFPEDKGHPEAEGRKGLLF